VTRLEYGKKLRVEMQKFVSTRRKLSHYVCRTDDGQSNVNAVRHL